jgi:DNA-directed RNA polymerase subunit RPC12/RpoP
MAGEFKQQCPSCEAMVSIKDETLVGKKTECTKCKFRFLVEAPSNPKPLVKKQQPRLSKK